MNELQTIQSRIIEVRGRYPMFDCDHKEDEGTDGWTKARPSMNSRPERPISI